ncbi:MAG: nucleotidyltransferase domain-containing protein [Candidatus Omnitrophica bacterium]|nr:nucleotidyltransferase domain-containing protein [Candidatus Omnitrophota bacterium]
MDITRIFKSKARKSLFSLYFTNPDKAYYLRELEREINTPVSIIRKELTALEKEGLFTSYRKGNLRYYKLNKDYPLYTELKNIVSKTVGVEGLLRKTISSIENIDIAFIYGSYAQNKEKAASDIDLFIVGQINENKLIEKINNLEKKLNREINYSLYSKKEFVNKKAEDDPFIKNVLKKKKILLLGDANDL